MRWLRALLVVVLIATFATAGLAQAKLKVGFIYVGPIGDYGWTHAHDQARRIVEKTLPVETLYVESVPEAQAEPFIEKLIQQGAKVVLTTSFGFMDGTYNVAKRYPNIIFGHASGFKRNPNMFTYMADFYQVYYLNGLMAGALTKSNKVAYVGAFPIPEVKRHLGAFALGVRAVNPRATIHVRWLYAWFDPAKAKEAQVRHHRHVVESARPPRHRSNPRRPRSSGHLPTKRHDARECSATLRAAVTRAARSQPGKEPPGQEHRAWARPPRDERCDGKRQTSSNQTRFPGRPSPRGATPQLSAMATTRRMPMPRSGRDCPSTTTGESGLSS